MSKPIFNSLGSNYNWEFALRALRNIFWVSPKSHANLSKILEKQFDGKAYLFLKGRDAIEFSLLAAKTVNPEKKTIFTQAFACYAIEEGITRAGLQTKYVDIETGRLNLSVDGLERARLATEEPLAVIVQHSLGTPAEIKKIAEWCAKHQVLLIEDLAQAFGGRDLDGRELGSYADLVVTSFGRDKIIDSVAGGACIIKNTYQDLQEYAVTLKPASGSSWLRKTMDLKYPLITQLIRSTYQFGLGKLIHFLARKSGLIKTPLYSPTSKFSGLPAQFADLAVWQLNRLEKQLAHRRKISQIYFQKLSYLNLPINQDQVEAGANLRFPVMLSGSTELRDIIEKLEKIGIHLSDRWYRQPVDCSNLKCDTVYSSGSCPRAEETSQLIVNLPTHQYISPSDARRIAGVLTDLNI